MVKQIISILLVCTLSLMFSQNKSFVYELKFRPNAEKDSTATERFILDINQGKSMFRTIKDKDADSTFHATKRLSFMTTSFKDFKSVYKNLKLKETKKYINNFQKLFSIKITEDIAWKIDKETKYILGMKSQKATTSYGGREYIAWFTDEIPLQEGPYVFQGLPGLITEIYDQENDFQFSLIQIKKSDGELYEKEKALSISWKQYEKLALDYYADPTRELNTKNAGSAFAVSTWVDEKGNEITPNFKEMNEMEKKIIRLNNNQIELNHKVIYK